MLFSNTTIGLTLINLFTTGLNKLIIEAARTPFEGSCKPEALKHDFKGYWSRRIKDEHCLVYRVEDTYIKIIACKLHNK